MYPPDFAVYITLGHTISTEARHMHHYPDSRYSVLRLEDLPPGLFGETYVVSVGISTVGTYFKGEYFILAQRPNARLYFERWSLDQASVPNELLTVDLEFMISESTTLAESMLAELLAERAAELNAPHLALAPIRLKPISASPFVGCQLRGLFTKQIAAVGKSTECETLHRYMLAVSQVRPIERI